MLKLPNLLTLLSALRPQILALLPLNPCLQLSTASLLLLVQRPGLPLSSWANNHGVYYTAQFPDLMARCFLI